MGKLKAKKSRPQPPTIVEAGPELADTFYTYARPAINGIHDLEQLQLAMTWASVAWNQATYDVAGKSYEHTQLRELLTQVPRREIHELLLRRKQEQPFAEIREIINEVRVGEQDGQLLLSLSTTTLAAD